MANIKIQFNPSPIPGREGIVTYLVTHNKNVRIINTDYRIYASEWDNDNSTITSGNHPARTDYLLNIRNFIRQDINRLYVIINNLEKESLNYTTLDIITQYDHITREFTLLKFMKHIITNLRQNGRLRTSETYTSTLNSFRKFLIETTPTGMLKQEPDIPIDRISPEIMESYQAWLRQRHIVPNTISFYARVLRATYNRAVDLHSITDRNPFRHVYTGIDRTAKRALPLSKIKQIKALDLSETPHLDFARDMFILSFCLRGMSFIDMAFLRKNDLRDGHITYRRRKTGQKLTIAWTPQMQTILCKYPENPTGYLLPIICKTGINEIYAYRNAAYNINYSLKIIASRLKINIPLTLYVARHSWASAAHDKGIPLSIISEGMGHGSEATTRIYLASIDTSAVDRANALILSFL